MGKISCRIGAVLLALVVGFYAGQTTKPATAKAAAATRVVHVQVSDSAPVPGWGFGTATGISCIAGSGGNADCYVVIQGN
jgi:hypothetical protein